MKKGHKKNTDKKQNVNRFNNFHQRDYDYRQLEKEMQKKQLKEMEEHSNESDS